MKFGIREICDVVFKAKASVEIGNRTFAKGEPVLYFDTLKTSTLEGAATTVYAQGGKGNGRLIAWEGERTVTFTMEDALISEMGLAVLVGAGLIDASNTAKLKVHTTERVAYKNGATETAKGTPITNDVDLPIYAILLDENDDVLGTGKFGSLSITSTDITTAKFKGLAANAADKVKSVMFDYYVEKANGTQIEINADSFGGTYYVEASTLFRDQDGTDHAAEFVIPTAKVQSNFNFSMASTGDPSTFTFTLDAFPGYPKFDPTKKVYCAIQVLPQVEDAGASAMLDD